LPNRLLILTQYFPPEMGAPQSRLYEAALGLQRAGWEVEVITALPNYPTGKIFPAYRGKFSVTEQMDGLRIRRYWLYASNSRRAIPRIISMVSFSLTALVAVFSLIKKRPTYIWVESPPLLLALSGYMMGRISGARTVLNISDLWPLSAGELGAIRPGGIIYRILESLERFLYRHAYACTGQSQEIVDYIERSGGQRVWLFRNGVNVERFPAAPEKSFQHPLKIVYAGLLGVAQGILEYCRQLEFDPAQIEFHIYGDGAERKAIESYLAQEKKSGIYLHASVKRDEVPAMLLQHDLTLIPLIKPIYGAVPSKIYEAMAAGLPILFAGGGEGSQIVEDQGAGWICPPSDFEAMQAMLNAIAQLPDEAFAEKRRRCLDAARNIFNREMQIEGLHRRLMEGVER